MDRLSVYRAQVPFETDPLLVQRLAYEGLGLFTRDVIGATTQVAGLACNPTGPPSLSVTVGPGRIYAFAALDTAAQGQLAGTGGLAADTNADHFIMKQGLLRDTRTFAFVPPVTAGQSRIDIIEAQFQEVDDAAVSAQFWNPANPNAPINNNVSPARRDICALQVKTGTPAATGSQAAPAADAGWVPVWAITTTNGIATIAGGQIAAAAGAPFISIGGGGGGTPGLHNWTTVTSAYTAVDKDRLIADTAGGAFTLTLPATVVADQTEVWIKGNFATNNLTVQGNGHGWAGFANPLVLNKDFLEVHIVYDGTNWRI